MTEKLLSIISQKTHASVFLVAQKDNQEYCRSEKYRKIYEYEGSPAGSMIRFVNQISEIMNAVICMILLNG